MLIQKVQYVYTVFLRWQHLSDLTVESCNLIIGGLLKFEKKMITQFIKGKKPVLFVVNYN